MSLAVEVVLVFPVPPVDMDVMVVVTSQKINSRKAMSAIEPALISGTSLRAMGGQSQFFRMDLPSTARMETKARIPRM